MKKTTVILILIIIIIAGLVFYLKRERSDSFEETYKPQLQKIKEKENLIRVEEPKIGRAVTSPLVVKGQARGTWFFEASFPMRLLDENGKELIVQPAQAQPDPRTGEINWITTEFVPFAVTLTFEKPQTEHGLLILEKDNPSGLAEHADQIEIPVKFR